MKKLLFSALACVAFAFSGFASNEEVEVINEIIENSNLNTSIICKNSLKNEDFFFCYVTIQLLDSKGNKTDDMKYEYNATIDRDGCYNFANKVVAYYMANFNVGGVDVDYNNH